MFCDAPASRLKAVTAVPLSTPTWVSGAWAHWLLRPTTGLSRRNCRYCTMNRSSQNRLAVRLGPQLGRPGRLPLQAARRVGLIHFCNSGYDPSPRHQNFQSMGSRGFSTHQTQARSPYFLAWALDMLGVFAYCQPIGVVDAARLSRPAQAAPEQGH